MINESNIVDVGNTPAVDQYYRDNARRAPDNLYIQGYTAMLASHQNDAGVPKPLFLYRTPTEPLGAGARPIGSVNITWGSFGGNAPVDYSGMPASAASSAGRTGSRTSTPRASRSHRRTS